MSEAPSHHYEFDAVIEKGGDVANAFFFAVVPPGVSAGFGKKGQIKVVASVNGYTYRTSIAPYSGQHYLGVRKEIREAIRWREGEPVHIVLEADNAPRTVDVPDDILASLPEAARSAFDRLSYSHQKEYVTWITEAKKEETRAARIQKMITMLQGGVKTPKL